jgi:hypothetical protein
VAYLVDRNTFINLLAPPTYPVDNSTPIGAAELAGDMTTQDITTTLFHNVFLFLGPNPPTLHHNCCILGFHSYDEEPGATSTALPRVYLLNYSSWMTPGLFSSIPGDEMVEDVTVLSHEMNETFNDPFVFNVGQLDVAPWWLAPNGNCQNGLETGDVIGRLPNQIYPITMNGRTYHMQNEALIQWFESGGTSTSIGTAIDGAYSYPNESVLPTPNVSQLPHCTGPA